MIYYNHFIGDYLRDTKELSLLEHGCYRLLLDHYYAKRGDMPADVVKLYRACNAVTPNEKRAVKEVADKFFPVNGDGRRHNKRADEEIEKAASSEADAEERKKNERERQRRHRERRAKLFEELRTVGVTPAYNAKNEELERVLNGHKARDDNVSVTRDKTAISTKANPIDSKAKGLRPSSESSIPPCPQQDLLALYAKHLPGLTQPRLWEGNRAESMRARWKGCSKKNDVWEGYATVEDGLVFWDKFFAGVAASPTMTEGIKRGDGSVWKPDLPWLLKAENFAKVIDGKYHG